MAERLWHPAKVIKKQQSKLTEIVERIDL